MRRRAFLRIAAAAAVVPVGSLAQRRGATDSVTFDAAARAYRVRPGGIQAAAEAPRRIRPTRSSTSTPGPIARGQALDLVQRAAMTASSAATGGADRRQSHDRRQQGAKLPGCRQSRRLFRRRRIDEDRAARLPRHRREQLHHRHWPALAGPIRDDLRKTPFFYLDGGGIKIYARSYPTIEPRRGGRQLHQPMRRRCIRRAPAGCSTPQCSATASSATTARRSPARRSTSARQPRHA